MVLFELMGVPVRAKLVGASENVLEVLYAQNRMTKKWNDFSAIRLVDLFNRYKPDGQEADEQLEALRKALGLKE